MTPEPPRLAPGAAERLSGRCAWAFFLCLLFLYLLTTAGHLFSPDEEVMFRTAESLARLRGLAIEPIADGFSSQPGRDGREYGQYGVGNSLLAVPFIWGGLVAARLAPEALRAAFPENSLTPAGRAVRLYRDPEGRIYRAHDRLYFQMHHAPGDLSAWILRARAAAMGAVTTALAALLLAMLAAELFRSRGGGVVVGLLYATCTVAWPHGRTFFSEPTVVLGMLFALWRLFRAERGPCRSRRREFLLAGAGVGWMLLCRNDSIFLAAGLGLYALLVCVSGVRAEKTGDSERSESGPLTLLVNVGSELLRFAVFPLLAVGVILVLNHWRFGAFLSTGYESQEGGFEFSTPLFYGLHGLLFSPGRSLFVFSPILLLAPWGLVLLARAERRLTIGLLAMILLHLVAMAKWVNWGGGWDWGPRHVFQLTPLLALPLGALLAQWPLSRPRGYLFSVLILLSLGMNSLGLLVSPIDSHLRLFEEAYARSGREDYARRVIARSPFVLAHSTPVQHAGLLLLEAGGGPVPEQLGPWRPGVAPVFSGYDYDLFFLKLWRAPVGWLRGLGLLPLLGLALSAWWLTSRIADCRLQTADCGVSTTSRS